MKKKGIIAWILTLCMVLQLFAGIDIKAEAAENTLKVTGLECEYTVNPIGLDVPKPRFSWKLESKENSVLQASYRIMASSSREKLAAGEYDVWDSKEVESDASVEVLYAGKALTPGQRYYWKVSVSDNKGNTASSTEEAYWETGKMGQEWTAKWIEIADESGEKPENYSIDFDFNLIKDDAGFLFAGKDTNNFLMWQINTFEKKFNGAMSFRPHQWVNGQASCFFEAKIDDLAPGLIGKDAYFNTKHHMRIEVRGKEITTFLNGTQIDKRTNEHAAYGKIGFRHTTVANDCDEQAAYDNIVIKDMDTDATLFEDCFDDPSNPNFGFGEIRNGELYVVNVLQLQKDKTNSAPMYRKEFQADKEIKKATVYATALGIYEMEVNGEKISHDLFNPGWTNYELNQDNNNYVMYQTFDVTDLVKKGSNVIGAVTGHGWYSGKLFVGGNNRYGKGSKFLAELKLEYEDGTTAVIPTDESWKISGTGPILEDDFQNGETYDARKEKTGWSETGYQEDSSWRAPAVGSYAGDIVAQMGPAVREIQEFKPKEITKKGDAYIINFGQNMSGYAKLKVKGTAGTKVKLRFGEMLKDGSLYTDNLRSAAATDYYTLKGDEGGEMWKPRFTFHGFQYMEVTGYPGELTEDDITAVAISSLQEQTGNFESSNDLVNQLQSNINWGQLDNFISVPTDCPQRDERLGYTGDSQVFVRTASMNRDVNQFFKKFLMDVTSNQRADGQIADWTPNYVTPGDGMSGSFGAAGWGDGVVIIPWTMYTTYGDTDIIRQCYDAMKKWIGYYEVQSGKDKNGHDKVEKNLIIESAGNNYGDWLSTVDTPREVTNAGYFAYSTSLLAKMAAVIGETEDAAYYQDLFERIRKDFNEEFVAEDGRIRGNTQTSYLIALKFDLLKTQEERERAAKYLVEDIEARNWHLSTGFMGVAYLCPILTEMGYGDVAYKLVLQETYPSWLYSVKGGATTIWERWNSYVWETGTFGDVGMNSFNHYSLGSVGEWFYNYAAGIRYDETQPGYKHIIIDPSQGGGFDYINASFDSVYGKIVSNWRYTDNSTLAMDVTIPANTTATVSIPAADAATVQESGKAASENKNLTFVKMEGGKAVYSAGSGNYHFTTVSPKAYMLNILDQETDQKHMVSINGGPLQTLPILQTVYAGDEIKLHAQPMNDEDFVFAGWAGDVESTEQDITVTVEKDVKLSLKSSLIQKQNLALGKPVKASTSINNSDWGSDRLTDGKLTSVAGSLGYTSNGSGDNPDVDHWVEVDLQKNTLLNKINLYPRTDAVTAQGKTASFPKDFTVEVCKEGESQYKTVASFKDYTAPEGKPAVIFLDEEVEARNVRIHVTKVGEPPAGEIHYFQLAEMAIYLSVDKSELNKIILEAEEVANSEAFQNASRELKEKFETAKKNAVDVANNQQADADAVKRAVKELENIMELIKGEGIPIVSVEKLQDITVDFGTTLENIGLPATVQVNLGDKSTKELGVEWKGSYNGLKAGSYTFTGSLIYETPIVNPDNTEGSVTVVVKDCPMIEGTEAVADHYAVYGTDVAEALSKLPGTVNIYLNDGRQRRAAVTWTAPEDYSATVPGRYTFIGEIEESIYYKNNADSPVTAKADIIVLKDGMPTPEMKEELKQLIASALKVDREHYSDDSLEKMDIALQKAREVLGAEDSLASEYETAAKALETAIGELVYVECKHSNLVEQIKAEPTCTQTGLKIWVCSNCQQTVKTEVIPMLDHTFGEWSILVAPDFGIPGIEVSSCSVCGRTQSRNIEELNGFKVTFADADGTVLKSGMVEARKAAQAPRNPEKRGYTFTGWDQTFTDIRREMVVTAQYQMNIYKISYTGIAGANTNKTTYTVVDQVRLSPVEKEGYIFEGWYLDGVHITQIPEGTVGDLSLEARFTKKSQPEPPTQKIARKGETYKIGSGYYKVTDASVTKGTVTYVKPLKATLKSAVVPSVVRIQNHTYKVTAVASKAFRNNKRLTKVTIGKNVKTIGSSAFEGAKKLKSIKIQTKVLKSVGKKTFRNIHKNAVIRVPSSKHKTYKKILKGKGQKSTVMIKK